ncbi:MAG TPA: hypothetical protein V6D11_29390 [Waterburya sp.]|jgi:hypothetical protein
MVKTVREKRDASPAYQQALEDFGITQLLFELNHYTDTDFNAQLMHLEEQELEQLAAILIQRLTNALNGKLIASYLNAIRYGNSHVISDPTHLEIPLPTTEQLTNLPQEMTPRYQEGDRVRWQSVSNTTDWGIVMGRFYARHHCQWAIGYLICLDPDSPSAAWAVTDTAWEEDLEPNEEHSAEVCSTSFATSSSSYPLPERPPTHANGYATLSMSLRQTSQQNVFPIIHKSLHTPPGNYSGESHIRTPRALTQRERNLIELYSRCQLGLTPKRFYAKWSVSYEQLAAICSRSSSTVRRWFARGRYYRRPAPSDLRHLAIMDFLLEHFEEIPGRVLNLLCIPKNAL